MNAGTQRLELPRLVTKEEVADMVGRDVRTVERWICAGKLPRPFHLFRNGASRWRRERIEAWVRGREQAEPQKLEIHK